MFNIGEKTKVTGIEKTGCTLGHIKHNIYMTSMVSDIKYTYFGKSVSRGTLKLKTCKGVFTVRFDERNGWARAIEII